VLDAGSQTAVCAACAAALGTHTPGGAVFKTLSLGYLLSLPALSLAALGWRLLRPRLAPQTRAGACFSALCTAFSVQLLAAGAIWYGVITGRILMTTGYFHHLMYGGWGRAITGTGLTVLGVSLLIAAWSWRRAQPPRRIATGDVPDGWDVDGTWSAEAQAHGLRLYPASGVATAALSGVLHPALLVNPAYWATLSPEQRALALAHEQQHLLRRDNLRKLALEGIALLYGAVPWVRRWAQDYELDSELAVDDACRRTLNEASYRTLVAEAAAFALGYGGAGRRASAGEPADTAVRPNREARRYTSSAATAPGAVSGLTPDNRELRSGLSHADLGIRLRTLAAPRRAGSALSPALTVLACALLGALPVALLLSHPVTRCLLACYLGY